MQRLYLRTLLLIIVLSAAIFAARLIGRTQPAPSLFAVIFTSPDGSPCEMPCMFGVRPGKMTLSEGLALLRQHPILEGKKDREPIYIKDKQTRVLLEALKSGATYTSGVTLQFNSNVYKITLGEVITLFGSPDKIDYTTQMCIDTCQPGVWLEYLTQNITVHAYVLDSQLRPDTVISEFRVTLQQNTARFTWHGFGLANYYSVQKR